MQETSNAVVFIGCGYPMGGVLFLAHMGVAIFKALIGEPIDLYFAAIDEESQSGFWGAVRNVFPESRIIRSNGFAGLADRIVAVANGYQRVIVHTAGGWGQTKRIRSSLMRVSRDIRNRISLVGTTHSYRNDSWLRVPMSLFQCCLYRLYYRAAIFQCSYAVDRFCGGRRLLKDGRGVIIPLGCEDFGHQESAVINEPLPGELKSVLDNPQLFKFIYLAAFRPGKNHTWLVTAMSEVLKTHQNARLILCGTGSVAIMSSVKQLISMRAVGTQVLMPGQVERSSIPCILSKCDCAVVTSSSETFGHSFLEPMFAGLPVLGTAVGVGCDIIKDGRTGKIISLKDVVGFQQAAAKMIENREQTAKMGEWAHQLVVNSYSHEAVARQHVKLYKQILSEGRDG